MADGSVFSLEGRGLKLDSAEDIGSHIGLLQKSSAPEKIKSINLQGNTIGVPAAQALAPHLSKLSALENANLADIFTGRLLSEIPSALDALLTALLPLKKLHTINLSDNAFGLNTQAPLVRFLEKHTPLRHLILNNNGLGPEAGSLIAEALSRLAEAKKGGHGEASFIETIVCGRNRLENGSSPSWAKALAAHARDLKEVRMTQNGIRVEGIQAILRKGLKDAKKLEVLDLQDNLFTLPGARALLDVLPGWTQLKELSIQDTLLRARGAVLLGDVLAKGTNKYLEVLRLQYNEIDIRGVNAILTAAKHDGLPKLRRLELNGNKFDEEDPAIDALRELLDKRKDESGQEDEDEDAWGLDELDELEEESDEEEEEAEAEDEDQEAEEQEHERDVDGEAASLVKQDQEAENEIVSQKQDKEVDELAEKLDKTEI